MDVSAQQSPVFGTENSEMAPKNIENDTKDELDDDELAIYIQFYFTTGN